MTIAIDLTGVAVSVIAGIFSVITPVALAIVSSRVKDQQARDTLCGAIANSLGALQQAGEQAVTRARPVIALPSRPGVPDDLLVGVQYVLNHAGDEAARLGVTPAQIADRIIAQLGLAAIKTNIATAASPEPAPAPLAPLPLVLPLKMSGVKNASP